MQGVFPSRRADPGNAVPCPAGRRTEPGGLPGRLVVYLSPYDGDNADADDDPYTGTDPDLLWIGVEIEGSVHQLQTVRARGY